MQQGRGFNIHSDEDANCIISGLTIRNSFAITGYNGAGIYCHNNSPVIRNCVIKNNRAFNGSGGGICFDHGNATVIDCTITANSAYYYGGGISSGFASPTIIGCTISGNSATFEGGGIDSSRSDTNIFNCIITDNNSTFGGGINCYSLGKQINMGVFGGTSQASKSGNIADLNIDGVVNFIDFTQCARLWNEQAAGIEDLDNDGIINLSDVEIISANWLWERQ